MNRLAILVGIGGVMMPVTTVAVIGLRVVANRRRRRRRAGGVGRVGVRVGSAGGVDRVAAALARRGDSPLCAPARFRLARCCAAARWGKRGGAGRMDLDVSPGGGIQRLGLDLGAGLALARPDRGARDAVAARRADEGRGGRPVGACRRGVRRGVRPRRRARRGSPSCPFVIGCAIALVVPTMLALAGDRYPGNTGALVRAAADAPSGRGHRASRGNRFRRPIAPACVPACLSSSFSCLCVALLVRLALHGDQVESWSTSEETA